MKLKVVLKLEFADEKIRLKAMKKVSGLSGLESITMDPKDGKLTLTGDIDPVAVVAKLRKLCRTDILTVGPAKEEPKKEAPKKEEPKKGDDKKKEGAPAKDDSVKAYLHPYYYQFYHHAPPPAPAPPSYYARNVEEDPNGCVIC